MKEIIYSNYFAGIDSTLRVLDTFFQIHIEHEQPGVVIVQHTPGVRSSVFRGDQWDGRLGHSLPGELVVGEGVVVAHCELDDGVVEFG